MFYPGEIPWICFLRSYNLKVFTIDVTMINGCVFVAVHSLAVSKQKPITGFAIDTSSVDDIFNL